MFDLIFFSILAIIILYFLSKKIRKRKRIQIDPNINIKTLWEACLLDPPEDADQTLIDIHEKIDKFSDEGKKEILNHLLDIEKKSLKEGNPIRFIRKEIMDIADKYTLRLFLHKYCFNESEKCLDENKVKKLEEKGFVISPEYAHEGILTDNIETYLLRQYSRIKYGDLNINDWFDLYAITSKFVHEEIVRMIAEKPNLTEIFAVSYDSLLKQTKEKCLEAAIGQSFENAINEQKKNFAKLKGKHINYNIREKK